MDCHFAFFHLFVLFDIGDKNNDFAGSGCVVMRDYFTFFVKLHVFRKIIRNNSEYFCIFAANY